MLKFLGCIIVISASTCIGFTYAEKFKKRNSELNEFHRCINQIQNEILYTHTPLPLAFLDAASKSVEPVKGFFQEIAELLQNNKVDNVYEAFKKVIEDTKGILSLRNEDLKILLDLSKTLGECDAESQKRMFLLTIEDIKKQIKSSEVSMNSNVKVCRYLGFCLGTMIAILLI